MTPAEIGVFTGIGMLSISTASLWASLAKEKKQHEEKLEERVSDVASDVMLHTENIRKDVLHTFVSKDICKILHETQQRQFDIFREDIKEGFKNIKDEIGKLRN